MKGFFSRGRVISSHDAAHTEVQVLKVSDYNTKKSFNNCRLSFVIIGKVGINGAHGGH